MKREKMKRAEAQNLCFRFCDFDHDYYYADDEEVEDDDGLIYM